MVRMQQTQTARWAFASRPRAAAAAIASAQISRFGIALLLLHAILAVFGPLIAPYHYAEFHLQNLLEPPSLAFPAGTDQFGRDQLSRVIWGARGTLVLATGATVANGDAIRVMANTTGGSATFTMNPGSSLEIGAVTANLRIGHESTTPTDGINIANISGNLGFAAASTAGSARGR